MREAGSRFAGMTVKNAPFSAESTLETVQKLGDGTRIREEKRTRIYRDSEGRTREEFLHRQGQDYAQKPRHIVISDPKAQRYYFAYNSDRGDPVYEEMQGSWERREYRDDDELGQPESLGKRVIEGVEAEGWRHTRVIAPGRIGNDREIRLVLERWHSPELKTDVLTEKSDPRRGTTTYRLTNIRRTEPLPTMFGPPAGYEPKGDDDDR